MAARPPSPERTEYLAQVGWLHECLAGLYEPIYRAIEQLGRDDLTGLETAIRFLEADVYCFRSGYVKVDVIRALTGVALDERASDRLRRVVLTVVDSTDRREFRTYGRLARKVDSEGLRAELRSREAAGKRYSARHAGLILARLDQPPPEATPPA